MFAVAFPLLLAVAILTAVVWWAWRNGTLQTTDQERVDFEFERIVRRLESPTA